MKTKRVSLLGFGAIGAAIARDWKTLSDAGIELVSVCARPTQIEDVRRIVPSSTSVVTDVAGLLEARPDSVIEAAGQSAIRQFGISIVAANADLVFLSVGALSDEVLRRDLVAAGKRFDRQLVIPAGAMAGFDGLLALAKSGLLEVRYTSVKPCTAWKGTPAETEFDLDRVTERTIVFSGTAAKAASLFPKNANLAAAIALAGIGFDETRVELIADPTVTGNRGILEARSATSSLHVDVHGEAETTNLKTSAIVAASVVAALSNEASTIRFS